MEVFMQASLKCSRARQAAVVRHAAAMRSAVTPSEAALWVHLRGGQLGVWFRRQVVIGRFVADFAAASAKLVVEVDGSCHARRGVADARRDRALARLGWRVVRVPAALVIEQPLEAVARVREALSR
jgi:very-short-patch-repair endonuclease